MRFTPEGVFFVLGVFVGALFRIGHLCWACSGGDDVSLFGGSTILLLILQPSLQQWKLHQAGVVQIARCFNVR